MAVGGGKAPPPPPQRVHRRPFITVFIDEILIFVDCRDLLECGRVSRAWHVAANSRALWSRLVQERTWRQGCAPMMAGDLALRYAAMPILELKRMVMEAHNSEARERGRDAKADAPARLRRVVADDDPRAPATSTAKVAPPPPARRTAANTHTGHGGTFSQGLHFDKAQVHNTQTTHTSIVEPNAMFGYALTRPQDMLKHRATVVERSLETIRGLIDAYEEQLEEREYFMDALRRQLPTDEFLRFHASACAIYAEFLAMEEVLAQAVVREALQRDRSAGVANSGGWAATAVQDFVGLEMLAMTNLSSTRATLWAEVKRRLPVDELYYDVLDFVQTWGPGWSVDLALREPNTYLVATDARQRQLEGRLYMKYAPLRAKASRIINERSTCARTLEWEKVSALLN